MKLKWIIIGSVSLLILFSGFSIYMLTNGKADDFDIYLFGGFLIFIVLITIGIAISSLKYLFPKSKIAKLLGKLGDKVLDFVQDIQF